MCSTGYSVYNGACVSSCPSGWYKYMEQCVSFCPIGTKALKSECLIDVNLNGTDWIAANDDASGFFFPNGGYTEDNISEYGLNKMEFRVNSDYGNLKGAGVCSRNNGSEYIESLINLTPAGTNCWCKLHNYSSGDSVNTINSISTGSWFRSNVRYLYQDAQDCEVNCASRCADDIQNSVEMRKNMFNKAGIKYTTE